MTLARGDAHARLQTASDVRSRTGGSVVAVERKGQPVDLDADTVLLPGDAVDVYDVFDAGRR